MTVRAVQTSLIDGMERPVGPIPGSVQTGTNADLIAAIAPLYLTGSVLDVTYGEGGWWKRYTPDPFMFHDLHKVDGVDFRHLPHEDRSFDAVCFDPPYVPQGGMGTSTANRFRDAYGLVTESTPWWEAWALIESGLRESVRVSRQWVLVKCMEFVTGGKFTDFPHEVNVAARELGCRKHDVIVHHAGSGPGGHNIWTPVRCRRHHSYLLVFEVAP